MPSFPWCLRVGRGPKGPRTQGPAASGPHGGEAVWVWSNFHNRMVPSRLPSDTWLISKKSVLSRKNSYFSSESKSLHYHCSSVSASFMKSSTEGSSREMFNKANKGKETRRAETYATKLQCASWKAPLAELGPVSSSPLREYTELHLHNARL